MGGDRQSEFSKPSTFPSLFPSLITRERERERRPPPPPSLYSLLHSGQLALATNLQAFNINATRYIPSNPTVVSPVVAFLSLSVCLCFRLFLSLSLSALLDLVTSRSSSVGLGLSVSHMGWDLSLFLVASPFMNKSRASCFHLRSPR